MDSRTFIPLTEARKKIFQIADDVQRKSLHITLTQHGKPKIVLLSSDEFDAWQETLEIMADSALMKEIKSSENDTADGKYTSLETILKQENYPITPQHVSGRFQKGRRKTSTKNR